MSDIDVNRLLDQMRALAGTAAQRPPQATTANATGQADFAALLKQSVEAVNSRQLEAGKLAEQFARGEPGTDLSQVMIALQKANISFQAMTQVRNKLVEAYQQVMNMPM